MSVRRAAVAVAVAAAGASFGACDERAPDAAGVPPGPALAVDARQAADPPAGSSDADLASRRTLERIVRAETTLAYHGYRTITHGARGESRETRLRVASDGAGRTLLEWAGNDASETRRWTVDHRFAWVRRPELLLRNYHVRADSASSDPVAWRETRRVEIVGRRPGRPSLELMTDAETGLVLAEMNRDAAGREWRSARFESVEFGAPPPADTLPAPEALSADEALSPVPADWAPLQVRGVPDGFERISSGVSSCGAWREDWSDGLAGFSVLQSRGVDSRRDPADEEREGDVRRRRWLGGASLTARRGGIDVTVYGSVADDELLVIVRGLAPPPADR